ncbi:hypothetical protein [Vreelandella titanicae]|uniref:hypothetical protein n=1 Tax=Vreelandella titanicae TaxID=664683 RepID=UPI0016482AC2|nr:hypothetical protein [Halomonas titanicae]
MNVDIVDAANAIAPQLSAQRRDFHRYPEQGWIEFPNARPALVEKLPLVSSITLASPS